MGCARGLAPCSYAHFGYHTFSSIALAFHPNGDRFRYARRRMLGVSRGLVWESLPEESIIVVYYDDRSTDAQWESYYALLHGLGPGSTARILGYCESSPPRNVLDVLVTIVRGKQWRVSLVSPSTAMRFVASTFSLAIRGFRFFPPEELNGALDHIGCNPAEKLKARDALRRLRGRPSTPP